MGKKKGKKTSERGGGGGDSVNTPNQQPQQPKPLSGPQGDGSGPSHSQKSQTEAPQPGGHAAQASQVPIQQDIKHLHLAQTPSQTQGQRGKQQVQPRQQQPQRGQQQFQGPPSQQPQFQHQPQPFQGQQRAPQQPHGPPSQQPQFQQQPQPFNGQQGAQQQFQGPPSQQSQFQQQPQPFKGQQGAQQQFQGPPSQQPQFQHQPQPFQGQQRAAQQPHGPPSQQPQFQQQPQPFKGQQGAQQQFQGPPSQQHQFSQHPQQQIGPPQFPGKQKCQQQFQGPKSPPQQLEQPQFPQKQQDRGPKQASPIQPVQQPTQQVAKSPPASIPSSQVRSSPDRALTRVNQGTLCMKKIPIEVNFVNLTFKKKITSAVHYDVEIKPDKPKSLLSTVMDEFRRKNYPNRYPSFDGVKNLYSPNKLPFGESTSGKVTVQADNGTKEYEVAIKMAAVLDLSPLQNLLSTPNKSGETKVEAALQLLNVVFQNAAQHSAVRVGRSFFTKPRDQILSLGQGMEMYYGFFQSVIRGWSMYLNVDVAHKAFPKDQSILELICELGSDYRNEMRMDQLGGNRPLDRYLAESLGKYLKSLKVQYEISNQPSSKRVYRVNGIGDPPDYAKFKPDNGPQITVTQYFATVKRVRLNYPHLPTLWVGSRDKKILVPLEFCRVLPGQAIQRKMNETQTSAMIKLAATSTDVRKSKIMKATSAVAYNQQACLNEFGLNVGNAFIQLQARVLKPPQLEYGAKKTVQPMKGVWRNEVFLKPASARKWTLVSLCRRPVRLDDLAGELLKMAPRNGMTLPRPEMPYHSFQGRVGLNEVKTFFQQRRDHDLIVCVIPDSGFEYGYVKQAAELSAGCLTQCIKERTMRKLNPQTVGNILLKLNSKLAGTNHKFSPLNRPAILNRPCMIMGADVTHPSPDAQNTPSVAAVTASHDPQAFCYNICWRLQPPKVEIIEDLCAIVKEQLMYFYKSTKVKPETIVFFRDGVSEGQFDEVRYAEIAAIQKACKMLQADGYEPKITFLVVQKRHHTRFFPTNPRDSEDRNNNVPAGTVVDTEIVNPFLLNFYLVSHASIQGVAKPTKYCALYDDNNMTNDDIQQLTYHLCHMFSRCTRSVSYPAPTYYAHLAAARAKVYIENKTIDVANLRHHMDNIQIHSNILQNNPMFFV